VESKTTKLLLLDSLLQETMYLKSIVVFFLLSSTRASAQDQDCGGDGSVEPDCKEWWNEQIGDAAFYLPHEWDCTKFWECYPHGVGKCLKQCAKSSDTTWLFFDYTQPITMGICGWPYDIDCQIPTIPQTTTTVTTTTEATTMTTTTTTATTTSTTSTTTTNAPTTTTTTTTTTAAETTTTTGVPTTTTATTITQTTTTTQPTTTTIEVTTTTTAKTTTTEAVTTTQEATTAGTTTSTTVQPTTSTALDQEGALKSISFNVSSCLGCPGAPVEGGLKVLLRGGGRQCETVAGLDHKDTMEYVSGQQVIFDGEPDQGLSDGLSGCYRSYLGNEVTGGIVAWLGSGIFAPHGSRISFELTGGKIYRCTLNGMALQNMAVDLYLCGCINCDL